MEGSVQLANRRQEPISCKLCRLKKRKCDRKHPCSNCITRNIPCERDGSLPAIRAHKGSSPSSLPESSGGGSNSAVLAKLERLEHLILQLNGGPFAATNIDTVSVLQQPTPGSDINTAGISAPHKLDTKRLEDVGTRENLMVGGLSDGLRFEILSIDQICSPNVHSLFAPVSPLNIRRIILLPSLAEALVLFDLYVDHLEYIHHILLLPRVKEQLCALYDYFQGSEHSVYRQTLSTTRHPALAAAPLLLALFASSAAAMAEIQDKTDLYAQGSLPHSNSPFPTAARARQCCSQWLKNTFECLDYMPHVGSGCIEDVQALTLGFFLVYTLEGFSARARTGMGRGILIARDLGLHRIDFGDNDHRDQAEVEIARRTWWHLCASDWLVALSGGPQEGVYHLHSQHMQVNLPRNIQDSELLDPATPADFEHPLSTPTSASYLIQRIKLAKICKKIVDAMPMSPSTPELLKYEDIVQLDTEFEKLIDDLPPFFRFPQPELTSGTYHRPSKRARKGYAFGKVDNASPTVQGDSMPDHIDVQRFMVRLTINTRRCKFHQPFLVRGFTDPQYHYSRDVCLRSARMVIEMQQALEAEGLAATTGLLGLSGLNHHIFFATIALVMDLCFNREEGGDETERKAEVSRAMGIMSLAQERSLVAKKFLEGIRDVLAKYRIDLDSEGVQQTAIATSSADSVAEETSLFIPEPQASDFDDIWQTYFEAPTFEVPGWDELFNDVESIGK